MWSRIVIIFCVFIFVSGHLGAQPLPSASPPDVGISAKRLARVGPIMKGYVDRGEVGGMLTAVARKGKIVHLETHGKRDIENGLPVTRDTIFRIYSMTKPITSVAAMILYEEGRFELTDPIFHYIPEFKGIKVFNGGTVDSLVLDDAKRPPTIQDLLRHTAGLTYSWGPTPVDSLYRAANVFDPKQSLSQFTAKIAGIPLLHQPGTRFHYSVATDILGRVIEVISGMPLHLFMDGRLFEPLKMRDTGFFVPPEKIGRFATNYQRNRDGKLEPVDEGSPGVFTSMPGAASGGGGLVSTADDYLRFCQMILNRGELDGARILGPRTVDFMLSDHLLPDQQAGPGRGFGLGFGIVRNPAQNGHLGSTGEASWAGLANTFFWINMKEELAFMVWSQHFPFGSKDFRHQMRAIVHAALVE